MAKEKVPTNIYGEKKLINFFSQPSEGTAIKCQNLTNGGNCL